MNENLTLGVKLLDKGPQARASRVGLLRIARVQYTTFNICLRNFLLNFLPDDFITNRITRPFIARCLGLKCGAKVRLSKKIFYSSADNIVIGKGTIINQEVFLDCYELIKIGSNVSIGFRVTFITSTHEIGVKGERCGKVSGKEIHIGDRVWIGAGAIIGPGVTIGADSIVSAGSVVLRSFPEDVVISGNPARVVQKLVH